MGLFFVPANFILIYLQIWGSCSKFLVLVDKNSSSWVSAFRTGSAEFDKENGGQSFDFDSVLYTNDSSWDEVCQAMSSGISAVIDLTHQRQSELKPKEFFISKFVPYYKVGIPIDALIKGANALMESKKASNGFLIFQNDDYVGRGVHLILGNTLVRYAFLNAVTMKELIVEKFDYRIPSGVLLFGNGQQFEKFVTESLPIVRNLTDWIFSFDAFPSTLATPNIPFSVIRGYFNSSFCCQLMRVNISTSATPNYTEPCNQHDCVGDPTEFYIRKLVTIFSKVLKELNSQVSSINCAGSETKKEDPKFVKAFSKKLKEKSNGLYYIEEENIFLSTTIIYDDFYNGSSQPLGQYSIADGFELEPGYKFIKRPLYYRIGIVEFKPWTYKDNVTNEWVGYCIDLAKKIAERMDFTYDFVLSDDFGNRDNITGTWNGLTGDLVHGKIDIAIAAYIMTSEREEYIDFVSPYFEQSGLLITMQRPVVKNSLFKFMTVLQPEVWFSIAGATVATGFMLWFLDKFSPYSAQNNPHKYKEFRKFTLKESFWFALTSFTPQGGGEPPKAFSGRTLVAAYWIFVVLMLATFTANLAAFLTVERMQSPIRNLEHLAGQSSVKYSVVKRSSADKFFRNMANAEELLYEMWRNLTLRAPSSDKQYIVWEYPIREMYIHINSVIEKTGYVESYQEGLEKASEDGYYAFIHDAAQTKYEVYRNCNLTLIGEAFAESPYAIAVAQGNPLQDNISMAILELQTERFFETLSTKYWSPQCHAPGEGEGDGIPLESLGGVFIATIIGLGVAFISLAFEVFCTSRARRRAKVEVESIRPKFIVPMDFYGTSDNYEKKMKRNIMPEVIN